jgi:hypothetical protein
MTNIPAPMNGLPVNGHRPPARRFRLAALVVVIIGVLALAAAAFVLSYSGVRDTALSAGVSARLARVYPLIFDGVLVVACAAAISLQGARWWLRCYAWLTVLVIIGTVAAADSVHAMAVRLPKRAIEATGAIVPWAVLLIGFTLLYAMARQAWPRRKAAPAPADSPLPVKAEPPAAEPPSAEPPAAGPPSAEPPGSQPAPEPGAESSAPEPAQEAEAAWAAEPARTGEAVTAAEPAVTAEYRARTSAATLGELLAHRADPAPAPANPLPVRQVHERDEPSDADAEPAPHFNRLRSTPMPPEDQPWAMETGPDDDSAVP